MRGVRMRQYVLIIALVNLFAAFAVVSLVPGLAYSRERLVIRMDADAYTPRKGLPTDRWDPHLTCGFWRRSMRNSTLMSTTPC